MDQTCKRRHYGQKLPQPLVRWRGNRLHTHTFSVQRVRVCVCVCMHASSMYLNSKHASFVSPSSVLRTLGNAMLLPLNICRRRRCKTRSRNLGENPISYTYNAIYFCIHLTTWVTTNLNALFVCLCLSIEVESLLSCSPMTTIQLSGSME